MVFYLVLWEGQPESEATWEDAALMEERFSQFLCSSKHGGKSAVKEEDMLW